MKVKLRRPDFSISEIGYIYILAALVFVVAVALAGWFWQRNISLNWQEGTAIVNLGHGNEGEEVCKYRRAFDGACVDAEAYRNTALVAVMIENSAEAWPLEGLAEASIVYEAPVEGSIPRFMAIYERDTGIKKAGPVRSARPYFLDWLAEYPGAMYMHVGGSPVALDIIKDSNVFDVNEFYRGWYFWRSEDRGAPHNTYTSSKLWGEAWDKYSPDNNEVSVEPWKFSKGEICLEDCITEITVPFGLGHVAHWVYSSSTDKYQRYQGSRVQYDQDGDEVWADTVIVQRVKVESVDAIDRKDIDTVGSGEVKVFRNGRIIEGEWKKEAKESRTRWYVNGEEIELQPGKIWIEMAAQYSEVEWE